MANKNYIAQITLPGGSVYYIKDEEARELIEQIAAGGLSFKVSTDAASTPVGVTWDNNGTTVTGTLVAGDGTTPSGSTINTRPYIYLVPHVKDGQGNVDFYREYVTVNFGTEQSPVYAWEFLGTTDIDLSGLGALAWKNNATGTTTLNDYVTAATFASGTATVSASYTPAGSLNVSLSQTATAASLTKGDYTPEGTINKPAITVNPTISSFSVLSSAGSATAGTAATFTGGTFYGGSFTQGTDTFVAPAFSASVASGTENLVLTWTAGSFTQGTDTYASATHAADTFVANTPTAVTMPTFTPASLMTGASAELATAPVFTGSKATEVLVTGVTYSKATVSAATFSGTEATINSTGTASGNVDLTKGDKAVTITVS